MMKPASASHLSPIWVSFELVLLLQNATSYYQMLLETCRKHFAPTVPHSSLIIFCHKHFSLFYVTPQTVLFINFYNYTQSIWCTVNLCPLWQICIVRKSCSTPKLAHSKATLFYITIKSLLFVATPKFTSQKSQHIFSALSLAAKSVATLIRF